jgi:hypothetical protein
MLVVQKMLNVFTSAGEKVIDAKDISSLCEQPLTKVRAEKSRPSGHQNSPL